MKLFMSWELFRWQNLMVINGDVLVTKPKLGKVCLLIAFKLGTTLGLQTPTKFELEIVIFSTLFTRGTCM